MFAEVAMNRNPFPERPLPELDKERDREVDLSDADDNAATVRR